jgi:Spy/CpxP family protein refolding chaperone
MNMNNLNTHSGKACHPIGKWLINRKLRKLKLDATQKEKVDALFAIASSARKDQAIEKSEVQEHFTTMMAEDGYDREKTAELIRNVADLHADRATDIANAFADLYEGLEPWQQQQVLAMWQKRRHCRSHRCH